jgi:hypothetical protein
MNNTLLEMHRMVGLWLDWLQNNGYPLPYSINLSTQFDHIIVCWKIEDEVNDIHVVCAIREHGNCTISFYDYNDMVESEYQDFSFDEEPIMEATCYEFTFNLKDIRGLHTRNLL